MAFARVKPGENAFKGLAREENLLPGTTLVSKDRSRLAAGYADWTQLRAGWRRELEALGRAFAAGDARLDPKNGPGHLRGVRREARLPRGGARVAARPTKGRARRMSRPRDVPDLERAPPRPRSRRRRSSSRRPPGRGRPNCSSSAASCCSRSSRAPRRSPRSPSRARRRRRCAGASSPPSRRRGAPARPARGAQGVHVGSREGRARAQRQPRLAARGECRAAARPDHRLAVRLAHAPDARARQVRGAAGEPRGRRGALPRGRARHAGARRGGARGVARRGARPRAPRQRRRPRGGAARGAPAPARPLASLPARGRPARGPRGDARRHPARGRGRAAAALEATGHAGPGGAGAVAAGDWIAFANELLTKRGEWRKGPALAKTLAGDDEALEALRALQGLPPAGYGEGQWEALGALVAGRQGGGGRAEGRPSPRTARPTSSRSRKGRCARSATEDDPTDLLLALDYRIHHILVDEFQDTSFIAVRAAGEAHRRVGARGRPHALRGGRPHAVDLPLPRGGGGPVPARAPRGHRKRGARAAHAVGELPVAGGHRRVGERRVPARDAADARTSPRAR